MTDRDRLIELIQKWYENLEMFPYLADYLLANGVIVPPLRTVGDKLYIHQFNKVLQKVVVECEIVNVEENGVYKVRLADGRRLSLLIEFIGRTVFLTKEEAEEKLRELK